MEILAEEDCLTADGFEEALIGYDDAVEFLDYNVVGSYLGEKTPLYVNFVTEEVHND